MIFTPPPPSGAGDIMFLGCLCIRVCVCLIKSVQNLVSPIPSECMIGFLSDLVEW